MKNSSLNVIKAISALLVVCIHCKFPGYIGGFVSDLGRVAVPIFFLISGYYSYKNPEEKIKKKIIHILKLMVIANILYFFIKIAIFKNLESIYSYVLNLFQINSLIKIVIFNDNPFRTQLWFFGALLYCYIIYYLILKLKLKIRYKSMLKVSLTILLIYIITSIIYFNNQNQEYLYFIRNFIFVGIPFFYIGNFINRTNAITKLNNKKIYFIIILSIIIMLIEINLYESELYISTILLATYVFIYCEKNPKKLNNKIIETIGDKYSTYIYVLHPWLKDLLNNLIKTIGGEYNDVILYCKPLILIIMSIAFSMLLYKINKRYIKRGRSLWKEKSKKEF